MNRIPIENPRAQNSSCTDNTEDDACDETNAGEDEEAEEKTEQRTAAGSSSQGRTLLIHKGGGRDKRPASYRAVRQLTAPEE